MAAELEAPVEADGKGDERDDGERLEVVAPRESIVGHAVAQYEMTIETDHKRYERGIDELEPQIAADDIVNALLVCH